jgi:mono/diheme cytochrome c family protein
MGQGPMHSMIRHQYVMREGIPETYSELTNPLSPSEAVLAAGQRVYTENCSACHGASGAGDGPAGEALDPSPSNIGRLPRMPMMSSDAYLYWTVAEGGVPIETGMPAFKQTLTPAQIWSVILYVREGL